MAIIDTFKIDNTPDASRIWKEMGSSFSNLSQALCEFVDDAVSNFRGNKEDESLRRIVRILVEQQKDAVDIVVEDGGTVLGDAQAVAVHEHLDGVGVEDAVEECEEVADGIQADGLGDEVFREITRGRWNVVPFLA